MWLWGKSKRDYFSLMFFNTEFERLHRNKRIKFIKISGNLFIYNARDGFLTSIKEIPKEYSKEVIRVAEPPVKTLILHTTYECNLRCNHCYLNAGRRKTNEMTSKELSRIVTEFGKMGGLSVDLSGGEALLKKGIEEVIYSARNQKLRTTILSNAIEIDRDKLKRISSNIDEIAVGIDGLYGFNDKIRGRGTFNKIVAGLELISGEGIPLSVTTLITPESLTQLRSFPKFMEKYNVRNWSLVMPRPSGRFKQEREKIGETNLRWIEEKNKGLLEELYQETESRKINVVLDHILVPGEKRRIEKYSKSFVYHIYNRGRACWDNTLTIMPNGAVKCCLFFDGQIYDNVKGKSLLEVYKSPKRERALVEFKKFPVDQCPFLELDKLKEFENALSS